MTGLDPISIGLTLASTALQGMAQRDVQKRQQRLSDSMTAYRMQKSNESQAAIQQFLQSRQPDATAAERSQVMDELSTGLTDSVGAVRKFEAPQAVAGKVSDDYVERRAANDATLGDRLKRAIGQLAVIGAPAEAGLREARRYGQAATGVDAANSAANNVSAYYQNAINNQQPNQTLSIGSQIAQGLGMARALGGLGKPAPKPYSPISVTGGSAVYGIA